MNTETYIVFKHENICCMFWIWYQSFIVLFCPHFRPCIFCFFYIIQSDVCSMKVYFTVWHKSTQASSVRGLWNICGNGVADHKALIVSFQSLHFLLRQHLDIYYNILTFPKHLLSTVLTFSNRYQNKSHNGITIYDKMSTYKSMQIKQINQYFVSYSVYIGIKSWHI